MKLSYSWLKEYLECELTPAQVAEAMTSIGIEVDSLEEQEEIPGGLAGVVVAKVLECEAHPDSDHLHITKVDAGTGEPLTVVCGAPNVAAGQKVLFATIGTVLPGDFKIKKSKIRGVESFGMICAQDELGIGTDHAGIMVLPDDAVVGTPAKDFLHLKTDAVIEYEITANRVDAASHWGVARDLYAYLLSIGAPCKLKKPADDGFKAPSAGKGIPFEVKDIQGAPRYSGITMKGVKVGPSPEWLQKDLRAIGLNPINNIVDISNFILFELGQPLHIFDAAKIGGGKVIVRRAEEGEVLRTLDGVERKLKATDMVIADATKPMCIAGVFGGEDSGVSDSTVDIFIEGAYFDPASIRKTSKTHGLQTDASFRYERGADPSVAAFAGRRAAALIAEVAGGQVVAPQEDYYPQPIAKKEIELDYERIQNFIGKKIGVETIEKILKALQYDFVRKTEKGAVVAAPTYMIDVYRECDVVEEILRIYGYNNIELPQGMHASIMPSPSPDPEAVRNFISNFLAANGFAEIMNNSLTKAAYYKGLQTFPEEKCVTIVNPLSSDLAVMRQSLIPNALEVAAYNINRQVITLRTFEYGSVYQVNPEADKTKLESYEEHQCFCLMMTGPSEKAWNSEPKKGNYFQLKGYMELLLAKLGVDTYTLEAAAAPADLFSEGLVYCLPGSHKQLAVMGVVTPAYARKFDVKQPVFVAEISWPVLFELVKRIKVKFSELPKFPEVRRDLALLFDENVDFASVRRAAFRASKKLLKQVTLFDVYRGEKIPAGKKQYALGFVFQDLEKTLTDTEIEKATEKLLAVFQNEFGAVLR